MTVDWSNHAGGQLTEQIRAIVTALSYEDGIRWHAKITEEVNLLESMPSMGSRIPLACFLAPPRDLDRLRQLIIRPYRIVYEVVGEQCRILAFVRCAALLTHDDTVWDR
ncbi:MAG: type II toxin-antitoxin system RelE/ParE family toxin [Kiritimatiellae bacterium]|nr:type II toxin-antitoxin system RelE/ParE family toxin [Kiritimatiellia bacterium]